VATGGVATGGVATGGAATGGVATGGTATGGTGGQPCLCRTVATLPVQGTACTGDGGSVEGDSVCDASGTNRYVCARGIWYSNNVCASQYPTPPPLNGDCTKGTACTYPTQGIGCACVNLKWMCVGTSGCPDPATPPATGDACNAVTGLACDYPNANAAYHLVCGCSANVDAGTGSTWTCVQSAVCPGSQPACGTSCSGTAVCTYGNIHCACMQSGTEWVCL
jgi:hypothetical protein